MLTVSVHMKLEFKLMVVAVSAAEDTASNSAVQVDTAAALGAAYPRAASAKPALLMLLIFASMREMRRGEALLSTQAKRASNNTKS